MTDVGVWDFSPAGYPAGAVSYTGPILFPAGIDAGTTKTGMVVFGPGGAVANFPAVSTGLPGLPPIIDSITVHPVAYGTTPSASTITVVSPGSAGVASHVTFDLYINSGQTGPAATLTIASATDIAGTLANGNELIWNSSTSKFNPVVPKVGGIFEVSSFPSTSSASTAQRQLSSVTIPGQPWDWWPEVEGQCVVTNAADTRVDLIAYIGSAAGHVVGRAYGAGNGVGSVTQVLQGAFGSDMPGGSGYGVVAASGSTQVIILRAENQVSSSNAWATGAGSFKVKVSPVP